MKTAIYPGTFDPITYGHMDVIERAAKIFDQIIVAVADDSGKKTLFTLKERIQLAAEIVNHNGKVKVDSFSGLLVEYALKKKATAIIRGLRAVTDFEYEMQMALMNRKLSDEIDTVFLMPSGRYTYLNSTIVREVAGLGGDVSKFVAPPVEKALKEKFKNL